LTANVFDRLEFWQLALTLANAEPTEAQLRSAVSRA